MSSTTLKLKYDPLQLRTSLGSSHELCNPRLQLLLKDKSDLILTQLTPTEHRLFALMLEFTDHRHKQRLLLTNDSHNRCNTYDCFTTEIRVAGGWVRDKLLGHSTNDIDLVVDRMGGVAFATAFRDWLISVGEPASAIGVIKSNPGQSKHLNTATFRYSTIDLDINHLRKETYAQTSRTPSVELGTPRDDAARRDFTVNSLFFNVLTGEIEDWTGRGLADLKRRILATPLPALQTFSDDPLRVLRAARFAGTLRWNVDEDVNQAARSDTVHQDMLVKVSRERIGIEIGKMLKTAATMQSCFSWLHAWNLHSIVVALPTTSANIEVTANEQQTALAAAILHSAITSVYDSSTGTLCYKLLSAATHCLDADPNGRQSLYMRIPSTQREMTLIAAYMLPYYGYQLHKPQRSTVHKTTLIEHIVSVSLKQRACSSRLVSSIVHVAIQIVRLSAMYASSNDSRRTDAFVLGCGTLLSEAKSSSHAALFLASILMDNNPSLAIGTCIDFIREESQLMKDGSEVWNFEPFIRGTEYGEWNDKFKVPNEERGMLRQHQLNYHMLKPHATEAEFRDWLTRTTEELETAPAVPKQTLNDAIWSVASFKTWLSRYIQPPAAS